MKHAVIRVPDSFEVETDVYTPDLRWDGKAIVVRCDEADVADLCKNLMVGLAKLSASCVTTEAPIGMEDSPPEGARTNYEP